MANTYRIQVITKEFVPEVGVEYQDAQYFDVPLTTKLEDFIAQKEAEINAERDARISRYVESVKNPPAPVEPTQEQLEAEKLAIEEQVTQLEARKVEVMSKIAVAELEVKEVVK
jgi:hypothetical protein